MSNKLAIIGFDAQLDRLENVDRVAAAFYKGESLKTGQDSEAIETQSCNVQQLCHASAERVLQANQLVKKQLAVIVVDAQKQTDFDLDNHYMCCAHVNCFPEALRLSAEIIGEQDLAVLIIAANVQGVDAQQTMGNSISFAQDFSGYRQCTGVACVLLASKQFAAAQHSYIYAYLHSVVIADDLQKIEQAIVDSFNKSALTTAEISSLEVTACADPQRSLLEEKALLSSYRNGLTLHTHISCVKSAVGENAALSQLLGFLNALFALQQRCRSAIKGWSAPVTERLNDWLTSPFYLLNDSAPAFSKTDGTPCYSAYSCLSKDKYAHLILQENNQHQLRSNGFNANVALSLFIVVGNSSAQLRDALQSLASAATTSAFKQLARAQFQYYQQHSDAQYCAVLLAESAEQLEAEIALALMGIATAFASNKEWKTPAGSYFAAPIAKSQSKISFLYPGIGATYLGLGRDLLHIFPEIYGKALALSDDLESSLQDKLLNPRSVTRLTFNELKKYDLALRSKLANIAECGVAYACLVSKVFTEILALKADFAAGYSMGEVSMFAALDCWQNPAQMSARLANSATFTEQLAGELKTLRALWDIPASSEGGETLLWESYNIKGTVEQVQKAIAVDERVYITLINTADSLVIAGYPEECLAVAKRLGVRPVALKVHNAIHSAPAYQQYHEMIELYTMDLAERVATKLFSSSCYLPVPFNKKALAVSIAKCLCEQVDFPRLINTLVDHGGSVFVEMGAGRSLSTWTDKILADKTEQGHCLTVASNNKGSDQQQMIARAAAKLLSFGVKINLNSFFYGSMVVAVNNSAPGQ